MGPTTRKYVTAATTFSVALGIGFVMQYGDAVASRLGPDTPQGTAQAEPELDLSALPVRAASTVPLVLAQQTGGTTENSDTSPGETSSDVAAPMLINAAFSTETDSDLAAAPQQDGTSRSIPTIPADSAGNCDITLTAMPAEQATVDLTLNSPCRPDTVVAIHHQGMMFSEITDDAGQLTLSVPVLNSEAFFIAAFDDGEGAVAITGVPSLVLYDRAVLQWQGRGSLQLHALEFGAAYGADGHVWTGVQTDAAQLDAGSGGHLVTLGNPDLPEPLLAEVYTFPSGQSSRDGAVSLSVEAEVTAWNCGRPVTAQSIQVTGTTEPEAVDLTLTMPHCDAVGEYLVLKNMFMDLTLAAK